MECLVKQAAQKFGDSPALIDHSRTITYTQLNKAVEQVTSRLRELGLHSTNRVGIILPNGIEQIILLMALIRIGALPCPISTRLTMSGVEQCLKKVSAAFLIADHVSLKCEKCRTVTPAEILGIKASRAVVETECTLDQPAIVVFTSGSTGEPKAVLLTLANLYYSALGSNQNIPFEPGDRWLLSLPLFHVGGLGILFRALVGGGAVVIDNLGQDTAEQIRQNTVTHLSLVSTQLYRLLDSLESDTATFMKLKAVLLGGSVMPSELLRKSVALGLPIHTSYGLTEMASQVTTTSRTTLDKKLFTSGQLLPFRQLRLSESGEIEVRGETRFAGYLEDRDLIRPFDSDGWFRTGDIGLLDSDKYLTVIGRIDTMFISGGENIYPEEIEHALFMIPGVVETVVVPVPDQEFGLRPCAFVRTTDSRKLDIDAIRELLREYLPGYKLPNRIFAWPSGAETAGFKPDRHSLRRLAERLCGQAH